MAGLDNPTMTIHRAAKANSDARNRMAAEKIPPRFFNLLQDTSSSATGVDIPSLQFDQFRLLPEPDAQLQLGSTDLDP